MFSDQVELLVAVVRPDPLLVRLDVARFKRLRPDIPTTDGADDVIEKSSLDWACA